MKTLFTVLIVLINIAIIAQNNVPKFEAFKCSRAKKNVNKNKLFDKQNQLLNNYDVTFYHLDLEATNESTNIGGNVKIYAKVLQTIDTLVFELSDSLQIDSLTINNISCTFIHANNEILIITDTLQANETFIAQIWYHGTPPDDDTALGSAVTSVFVPLYGRYTWTLSEPFGAKAWFPCKQILEDKADSVYIFITTDSDNKVGANGILSNITLMPNSKMRYEWKSVYPIAYYLISFAVGEYKEVNYYAHLNSMPNDSLLIQNYVFSDADIMLGSLNRTAELIELFSDLYGDYPFKQEKYGHCQAALGGGMEHQTMTTIGMLGFGLIAHELSHQWFGDNVTCKNWQEIWVNEGFASYSEYLAEQYLESQEDADNWMQDCIEEVISDNNGSVYVPDSAKEDAARIFSSRLSYKKGAALVHMIRFLINNDSIFFEILQQYQITYKDKTATAMDFKTVLENVSGIDFTEFFNQWYYGNGFPVFNVSWDYENDTVILIVNQHGSADSPTVFNTPMEYKLIFAQGGDTIIRLNHNSASNEFYVYMPEEVVEIQIDPNLWVLKKIESFTNIQQLERLSVILYPNPVQNELNIQLPKQFIKNSVLLYSTTGQCVYQNDFNTNIISINTMKLPKGNYFIVIKNKNAVLQSRFVKW